MSTIQNKAAWLDAKQARPLSVGPAPMRTPDPNEVVVRVHAVSINPVDAFIQSMGVIVQDYPYILGTDVAGVITAVGSSVTNFKVGDRVLAETDGADPSVPDARGRGAFQLYTAANHMLTAKIPDGVSFKEASVLPLCFCTAAAALYETTSLGLPLPQVGNNISKKGEVFVVWGVGSAVGANAVQMAKASGYDVIATCSEHNFEFAKNLGADYAFDYKKDSVVEDVLGILNGKKCAGVLAAMVGFNPNAPGLDQCGEIASKAQGRHYLATVIPATMEIPNDFPKNIEIGRSE
ncbi:MAG: hypothetical protein Q9159_002012 [Coniocarpon cinnabarinum]